LHPPFFEENIVLDYQPRFEHRQHLGVDEQFIMNFTVNAESILDCGCGTGSWGQMIHARYPYKTVVGVDLWQPYLYLCQSLASYSLLLHGTVSALPFRTNAFDLCLAVEVIEHLPLNQALTFIAEAKRTSQTIILTTPTAQYETHEAVPTENHRSYWTSDGLAKMDFTPLRITETHLIMGWKNAENPCDRHALQ
jgi:2-polyprenyl-3-methyl-5-hydroxy-6-metoxy-1,4-benzoquinol methylase